MGSTSQAEFITFVLERHGVLGAALQRARTDNRLAHVQLSLPLDHITLETFGKVANTHIKTDGGRDLFISSFWHIKSGRLHFGGTLLEQCCLDCAHISDCMDKLKLNFYRRLALNLDNLCCPES
eukprot:3225648-Amphidinium_carterae.2